MADGHGGRRAGVGRPAGSGSPLRALARERAIDRAERRRVLRDLIGTDGDPVVIALGIARNPNIDLRLRADIALQLLQFVHPRTRLTSAHDADVLVQQWDGTLDLTDQETEA